MPGNRKLEHDPETPTLYPSPACGGGKGGGLFRKKIML
jgi:hypothetical protein